MKTAWFWGSRAAGLAVLIGLMGYCIALEAHSAGWIVIDDWRSQTRDMIRTSDSLMVAGYYLAWRGEPVDWDLIGQFWTYSTVHASLAHLEFNMIPLAVLGVLTVWRVGVIGLVIVYCATAVLSAIGYVGGVILPSLAFLEAGSPFQRLAGASGAVHGLGGAWVIWAWADRKGMGLFDRIWPALAWFSFILAVNLYLYWRMSGGFAWSLHLTGVVSGMMLAPFFKRSLRPAGQANPGPAGSPPE